MNERETATQVDLAVALGRVEGIIRTNQDTLDRYITRQDTLLADHEDRIRNLEHTTSRSGGVTATLAGVASVVGAAAGALAAWITKIKLGA